MISRRRYGATVEIVIWAETIEAATSSPHGTPTEGTLPGEATATAMPDVPKS
ncbi:hypothetical protein [Jiella pacifica]|uniref:Uncharacterized protein n=1 Tax=Jiella pacifica TaxID=2696469 RepID=A0A6N9T455_9HYPH|nr:hypothetical protein [Jiella pacifica]NDW06051.1 hypothetical protein [Jiella pacifica]